MSNQVEEPKKKELLAKFPDEEFIFYDGYDKAIIGVSDNLEVVYSFEGIISILTQSMEYEDAIEFFDYNISPMKLGDKTPIIVHPI